MSKPHPSAYVDLLSLIVGHEFLPDDYSTTSVRGAADGYVNYCFIGRQFSHAFVFETLLNLHIENYFDDGRL